MELLPLTGGIRIRLSGDHEDARRFEWRHQRVGLKVVQQDHQQYNDARADDVSNTRLPGRL